jgi:hypothetical protein
MLSEINGILDLEFLIRMKQALYINVPKCQYFESQKQQNVKSNKDLCRPQLSCIQRY